MSRKPSPPLLTATFLLLFSSATTTISAFDPASAAFNITRLLSHYPEFGAFNNLLSQTKLADLINHHQIITVLALNNHSVSTHLAGKPLSVIENILSVHVVLDFFGLPKLRYIVQDHPTGTIFATLFQTTGKAQDRQGFINVSVSRDDGSIAFGSALKGSPLASKLVGSVAVRPYNISVLQVSEPIVPLGVDPNPSPPPPPAPAGEDDSRAEAPGPASHEEYEEADAPVADSPEGDVMAPSEAPASDAPEPEVVDQSVVVELPDADKSGSGRPMVDSMTVVGVGVMIGLLSFFVPL